MSGDEAHHERAAAPSSARITLRALACGVVDAGEPVDDRPIALVTDDSRRVIPGALFVAKRGAKQDGATFIADAVARGAIAVVVERDAPAPDLPRGVALLTASDPAHALATLAERFHGEPSRTLGVVGVTGTNGKTTTSTLTRHLLERAGVRTGLISTCAIDAGPGASLGKAMQTTPGAVEIAERLGAMRDRGCAAAVIETSSHALDQRRVAAVRYRVAVFTNLTGDHLDYHGTMERYADAKARLFETLGEDARAVLNADDTWAARMARDCRVPIIACALHDADHLPSRAELAARLGRPVAHAASVRVLGYTPGGMAIDLRAPFGDARVVLPLVGTHNAMNALQAACAAWALGAPGAAIIDALASAPAPPGRLEPVTRVAGVAEPFAVLVDYAHTDDALERALLAVRPLVRRGGSLRVVFGCGGDRDRTKRPRMGAVAARLADSVVITSDNPRTEDPASIVEQVAAGARAGAEVERIVDRESAIRRAIDAAREGDVVLIAGKGHEDYQILSDGRGGTVTRHFDDREVARDALSARLGAGRFEQNVETPVGERAL